MTNLRLIPIPRRIMLRTGLLISMTHSSVLLCWMRGLKGNMTNLSVSSKEAASFSSTLNERSVSSTFPAWFTASGHRARWRGEQRGSRELLLLLPSFLLRGSAGATTTPTEPRLLGVQLPQSHSSRSRPRPSLPPACTSIRAPRTRTRHSWQSCENLRWEGLCLSFTEYKTIRAWEFNLSKFLFTTWKAQSKVTSAL